MMTNTQRTIVCFDIFVLRILIYSKVEKGLFFENFCIIRIQFHEKALFISAFLFCFICWFVGWCVIQPNQKTKQKKNKITCHSTWLCLSFVCVLPDHGNHSNTQIGYMFDSMIRMFFLFESNNRIIHI